MSDFNAVAQAPAASLQTPRMSPRTRTSSQKPLRCSQVRVGRSSAFVVTSLVTKFLIVVSSREWRPRKDAIFSIRKSAVKDARSLFRRTIQTRIVRGRSALRVVGSTTHCSTREDNLVPPPSLRIIKDQYLHPRQYHHDSQDHHKV